MKASSVLAVYPLVQLFGVIWKRDSFFKDITIGMILKYIEKLTLFYLVTTWQGKKIWKYVKVY